MSQNYPDFIEDRIANKLSAEEFCRKLCSWYEDQGLVSELRTHLRTLMITALKGTSLGPKSSLNSISPKIQTINLLIAEFLMQQKLHYTLSVFSSEVPLHAFTTSVGNIARGRFSANETPKESHPQFLHSDLLDMLETLGFPPNSRESNEAVHFYTENKEALLTCIFRVLPSMTQNSLRTQKPQENSENTTGVPKKDADIDRNVPTVIKSKSSSNVERTREVFNVDIHNILVQSNLKEEDVQRLQYQFARLFEFEIEQMRQDEESKYQKVLLEKERILQENLIEREGMFRELIDESQGRIAHERQEINNMAIEMRESHEQVARRFTELEEWGQALQSKELEMEEIKHRAAIQMADKMSHLDIQQRQLDGEFNRLRREQEEMELLQNKVVELKRSIEATNQSSSKEVSVLHDLHHQCLYLRRELESTRNLLDKQSSECLVKKQSTRKGESKVAAERCSSQMLAAKEMCRQLQQENAELRSRTRLQDRRIEELTARAAHLVIELENASTAVTLLSGRDIGPNDEPASISSFILQRRSATIAAPPPPPAIQVPPPPPLPAHIIPEVTRRVGAGEESIIGRPVLSADDTPHRSRTVQSRDARRKPPKRLVVYSSDDSSPTEEMLLEARSRLRTLEEESEAVDRRFRDFRQRHTAFLDSTAVLKLQSDAHLPDLNRLASTSHGKRNQSNHISTPSYGFHAEYECTLPSYTRLNSRPSLYHQVTDVNAQSRTNRMTHLFGSTTQNNVQNVLSHQTLNGYASITRPSQIPAGYVGPSFLQQPTILTLPAEARVFSPIVDTTSGLSEIIQIQSSTKTTGHNSVHDANHFIDPHTTGVASGMVMTSIYDTPQVSHFVETTVPQNTNQAVGSVDRVEEQLPTIQPLSEQLKNIAIGNDEKSIEDNLTVSDKSEANLDEQDTLSKVNKVPVVLYSNVTNVTSVSPSASETSSQSAVMSSSTKVRRSVASERVVMDDNLLPGSHREYTPSDRDVYTPLKHPSASLETCAVERTSSSSAHHMNDKNQEANEKNSETVVELGMPNTSANNVNLTKSTTAVSGTALSERVLAATLPQLPNISLSSIELSSDVISAADDKVVSDDDFWASS